jgi:hypothetical protein
MQRMNARAKFLVLFDTAPRALLLDGDQRLLGEVIEDDGFIVDTLLRTAMACALPMLPLLLASMLPPMAGGAMRCFELC